MQTNEQSPGARVFTIGHSNHPIEKLLGLLEQHAIEVLVDVRSSPYSQYSPQFNQKPLQQSLEAEHIRYLFFGDSLGGKPDRDGFTDSDGYVLYDRIAASERFRGGLERLLKGLRSHRVALMCSEEDPVNCHRRLLITRVLLEHDVEVLHIRGDGRIQSEEEVAKQEEFEKTGGQIYLFEPEEGDAWKSTRSVSPKKAPPNSSAP